MLSPQPLVPRYGAALAALLLAACGQSQDSAVNVVAIGAVEAPFENGARLSLPAQLVRAATAEGLVGLDAQGRVIPALADRWIVTDDGQSYIFRLREGVWADKSEITAQSARAALRDAVAALRGTALALDFSGVDEIRVMAGRVIEIRLVRPNPDFLQLLAQPEFGLVRRGKGAGAMKLTREGRIAQLSAIAPEVRGLPAIEGWKDAHRPVRLRAMPAEAAVQAFNSGQADILLGGRIESFPLASSVGLARGTIQVDPVAGLFGLAVAAAPEGFLVLPENREALALAIDREGLLAPFGVSGWTATTRVIAPGSDGDPGLVGERWIDLTIEQRRVQARNRVDRWRAQHPGPLRLRIALPPGRGADILYNQLREDLAQVGIEAVRTGEGGDADLRLVDAVARYAGIAWYLNQLSCAAARGLCSAAADALASKAVKAPDTAARAKLLGDAEAELTRANVFIPFGAPIRWSLVRGQATGFAPNRWGVHPLMPMSVRPR